MKLLLDTRALPWGMAGSRPLTAGTTEGVGDRRNVVWVSAATIWEIEIKRALGRLESDDQLLGQIDANDFHQLAITGAHALLAGRLPRQPRGPVRPDAGLPRPKRKD